MTISHLPDWVLERYLLGELPFKKIKDIDVLCKQNEALAKRIEGMCNSNREILKRYSCGALVPEIIDRFHLEKSKEKRNMAARTVSFKGTAAAFSLAALTLVLVFGIFPLLRNKQSAPVYTGFEKSSRVKGGENPELDRTHLILHRNSYDGIEVLTEGDEVKRGDLLQLAYVAAAEPFGMIFSVDGNGSVTLHYPENKQESTALIRHKKIVLPHAYELDDAPDFERFFFITSSSEINVREVLKEAEIFAENPENARTAYLGLDFKLKQFTIIVRKDRE